MGGIICTLIGSAITLVFILILPVYLAGSGGDIILIRSIFQVVLAIGIAIALIGVVITIYNPRLGKIIIAIGGICQAVNWLVISGATIIIEDLKKYNKGNFKQEDVKRYFYQAIIMVIISLLIIFLPVLLLILPTPSALPFIYVPSSFIYLLVRGSAAISAYFNNPEYCMRLLHKGRWKEQVGVTIIGSDGISGIDVYISPAKYICLTCGEITPLLPLPPDQCKKCNSTGFNLQ